MIVLTDWQEFAELDLALIRRALRHPIVIDGRNLFRREQMQAAGLQYHSIGRPTTAPARSSPPDAQGTVDDMLEMRSIESLSNLSV